MILEWENPYLILIMLFFVFDIQQVFKVSVSTSSKMA